MFQSLLARGAIVSVAALSMHAAGFATQPPEETIADLKARVAELEQSVALLSDTDAQWLTEQRAEEVRELVQDVLADADTRASLLQDGMSAGYDNGFFIGSGDGNFSLKLNGLTQFRWMYNHQDKSPVDDNRSGFENTRTQLIFSGNVVSPEWVYRIQGEFGRDGGTFSLLDAYIAKVLGDSGWLFIAGQFKVPMLREELVYSGDQLAVERSLVNQEFTAGRTQGVALDYRNDQFHVIGGFTDGHPATGGFNAPALSIDTEYSLTARAELLLQGDWSQFNEFTSFPDGESGVMIGGAIHYQKGEYGTTAPELEVLQWTVDASVEFGGANLFAYVVGRHLSDAVEADQYGVVVQGGYFVNEDWELYARYEWGDDDTGGEDLSAVTVGVNRYFAGQQLKWTTDIGYGFNEVAATWGDGSIGTGGSITGWRTDTPKEDGQYVLRTQLQLLF